MKRLVTITLMLATLGTFGCGGQPETPTGWSSKEWSTCLKTLGQDACAHLDAINEDLK